jgi:hypothetical protein
MIIENGNAMLAYLMNTAREYGRKSNGGESLDNLKVWAKEKITSRPDLFHSYKSEVLPMAANHLLLFCMGEPSQFDAVTNL